MPNPFAHIELSTDDLKKAKKFYQSVFAWKLSDMPGMAYTMVDVGGGVGGGMQKKQMAEAPTAWLPYVQVDDLKATMAKAIKAGAKPALEYQEIGEMGAIAIFIDPAGATLGLWQSATAAAEPTPDKPAAKSAPEKSAAKSAPDKSAAKSAPEKPAAKSAPEKPAAKSAPARSTPAKSTPAKGAPSKSAPAKGSAKSAPAKSAPAKSAPAKNSAKKGSQDSSKSAPTPPPPPAKKSAPKKR
jgi:predicted enzyme related to lactoylglutathione lyase